MYISWSLLLHYDISLSAYCDGDLIMFMMVNTYNVPIIYFANDYFVITIKWVFPVHYPTGDLLRKLGLLKQRVTIWLHYQLNDLNTEKISAQQICMYIENSHNTPVLYWQLTTQCMSILKFCGFWSTHENLILKNYLLSKA